jgi:hypothetical protein
LLSVVEAVLRSVSFLPIAQPLKPLELTTERGRRFTAPFSLPVLLLFVLGSARTNVSGWADPGCHNHPNSSYISQINIPLLLEKGCTNARMPHSGSAKRRRCWWIGRLVAGGYPCLANLCWKARQGFGGNMDARILEMRGETRKRDEFAHETATPTFLDQCANASNLKKTAILVSKEAKG